jgi:hypothetical protein
LKRKGKGNDVAESEVTTLVAIHNNMNEVTWQMLLQWEQWHIERGEVADNQVRKTPKLVQALGHFSLLSLFPTEMHGPSCTLWVSLRPCARQPKLLSFMGRPFDLTPKATSPGRVCH